MSTVSNITKGILFCALLLAFSSCAPGSTLEQQRGLFLQAEQAIAQNRWEEVERLLPRLAGYPLLPYLLYLKLAKQPQDGSAIAQYLERYGETRYAPLLRKKRLQHLAAKGSWHEYVELYQPSEDVRLQCQYYWSLFQLGRVGEAFAGAGKLWTAGSSLPDACSQLSAVWQASPHFNQDRIWQRFALALRKNDTSGARDLKRLLPESAQHSADFWLKVHDHAQLVLACAEWRKEALYGQIFTHGIDRLAASDPWIAVTAWNLRKHSFSLDSEEQARIDRRLALALATRRHQAAGAYLQAISPDQADDQIRAWRVRNALLRQDWAAALTALEAMEPAERAAPAWRYWRARAHEALGDNESARATYEPLARERNFYGFMAADRLNQDYQLIDQPLPTTETKLTQLAERLPFLAIREFRALQRVGEVRREWMHAIKTLSRADLLAAAKLAQRWGLDHLAIITIARAGDRDDLALRFPLTYYQPVMYHAGQQRLDPAVLYGLMRRESAFDPEARSPAGARGLLQLLPGTAQQIARLLHESWPSARVLFDPDTNLRYGAAYFARLLERFNNHLVLATAAYNAGPGRAGGWLPEDKAVPADIWIETIPFKETREYVGIVLEYAIVYQHRMGRPIRRLNQILSAVAPGNNNRGNADQVMPVNACE
jgi:soluble lytic murein transglycosylase